jgi:hypothetical protein
MPADYPINYPTNAGQNFLADPPSAAGDRVIGFVVMGSHK